MKESTTRGMISLDGFGGLVYDVGVIEYTVREDESFRYTFAPNWAVIDLLAPPLFQGVPGFDLSLRKELYVRDNITPTFVSERAPSENREGLWELLAACDMEYLDKIEWLIRTDTRYIGDGLYVRALGEGNAPTEADVSEAIAGAANSEQAAREVLATLCQGGALLLDGEPVSDDARKVLHDVLLRMYEKAHRSREEKRSAGVRAAAERGAYAGRKRKPIDELLLREAVELYEARAIDAEEAAAKLGVSASTFFRRLKELRAQS